VSKIKRKLDEPWLTWNECLADFDSGCVVDLPHSADRLDVGLAIFKTESGAEAAYDLCPGGTLAVRKAWGELLSLREQWQHEQAWVDHPELKGDVPDDWWPDEETPAWRETEPGKGDEIWVVTW
jgi:hypothetical protein